jgi:hypothetical protein
MMKRIALTFALVVSFTTLLYSESIFLTDGTIIKGKLVHNSINRVVLDTPKGRVAIPGKKILRIAYSSDYEKRKYIYLKNGKLITGYLVGEEREFYIIRRKLLNKKEEKVRKSDISFIARRKIITMTEPDFIVGKGPSIFKNLLGVRIIGGFIYGKQDFNNYKEYWGGAGPGFGIYYFDKFIEGQVEVQLNMGADSSGNLSMGLPSIETELGFYPFNVWNVGIGLTIGFTHVRDETMSFGGLTTGTYKYEAVFVPVGITYRLPNLLRVSFRFLVQLDGSYYEYPAYWSDSYNSPATNFNFNISTEFWVWKTLSVRLSYTYMDLTFTDGADAINHKGHLFTVALSYGFQLKKKW